MENTAAELLARVPLFRQLEEKQLAAVAQLLERRTFQTGQVLGKQGEPNDELFLIDTGEIDVLSGQPGALTTRLGRLRYGSCVGELAMLGRQRHRATYVAVMPVVCLVLRANRLADLLRQDPELALALLRRLSQRVPDADKLWFQETSQTAARPPADPLEIGWRGATRPEGDTGEISERAEEQLIRYAHDFHELYARTVRHEAELRESVLTSIKMIIRAAESKDDRLRGHSVQTARWTRAAAARLGWDEPKLAMASLGGLLHDVGLIAVDRHVLAKIEGYTSEEWALLEAHPQLGAHIVGAISFLRPTVPFVLYHHERLDGRGYPKGLTGTQIPPEGRLMAVVEAFAGLLQRRPSRDPQALESAANQLRLLSGHQLDPACVTALLDAVRAGEIAG